jgi:hypothetical protein
MLESTQVRSGLERGLAELESLGLVRPPNVLLAEYLRALTAEDVLDLAAADQVSAAYNCVRYSAAGDGDPQVREAAATLDRVAERLAAMGPQDRQQIAARVCQRIQSLPAEQFLERDTERLGDARKTAVAPSRQTPATRKRHVANTSAENALSAAELSDPLDPFVSVSQDSNGRRSSRPRVPLELSAVVALATFFGGYFFRDGVNKTTDVGDEVGANADPSHVSARDAWKNTELWVNGLRFRADEEARSQRYAKARRGFELALVYLPDNPSILNDLASLDLTPDEAGRTHPKRALELVQRALEFTRQPTVLDTAAEAQFQCGNIRAAIRLEGESLTHTLASEDEGGFRKYRETQLKKFQDADQIRTAQSPPPPNRSSREPAKSRMNGPLASGPSDKPAGS